MFLNFQPIKIEVKDANDPPTDIILPPELNVVADWPDDFIITEPHVVDEDLRSRYTCDVIDQLPAGALKIDNSNRLLVNNSDVIRSWTGNTINMTLRCTDIDQSENFYEKAFTANIIRMDTPTVICTPDVVPEHLPQNEDICNLRFFQDGVELDSILFQVQLDVNEFSVSGVVGIRFRGDSYQLYVLNSDMFSFETNPTIVVPVLVTYFREMSGSADVVRYNASISIQVQLNFARKNSSK